MNNPIKFYHVTAPTISELGADVQYARTIIDALREIGVPADYVNANHIAITSENLRKEIFARAIESGHTPAIHLQLRPPNGGTAISPEDFRRFPLAVITVHEYSDLHHDQTRARVLEYARLADHVIFTNQFELEAVAQELPSIWEKATVAPVHPAMPVNVQSPESYLRPNNIAVFGTVKSGVRYEDVIALGETILADNEISQPKPRIMVIGRAVNGRVLRPIMDAVYPGIDWRKEIKELMRDNPEVAQMMGERYKLEADEEWSEKRFKELANNVKVVVAIWQRFEAAGVQKALPIDFYFDVEKERLPALFFQANFGLHPIERGATHHSSSLPTAMANGVVCMTTKGEKTPLELEGAVGFYTSPEDLWVQIKQRIQSPELNIATRHRALEYLDSISVERSADKHFSAYYSACLSASTTPAHAPNADAELIYLISSKAKTNAINGWHIQ